MLLMVLLGGRHPQARLEVHDIVFVEADTLSSAHSQLKAAWFGDKTKVHIDSWMQINGVPGYYLRIESSPPPPGAMRLFFVHHGGYLPERFGEEHQYCLVAAEDKTQAKQKSKQLLPSAWQKPHTDHVELLDDISEVTLPTDGRFIVLTAGTAPANHWENDYIVLN